MPTRAAWQYILILAAALFALSTFAGGVSGTVAPESGAASDSRPKYSERNPARPHPTRSFMTSRLFRRPQPKW